MIIQKDQDLVNSFHLNSGHSKNSIKSYKTVFNKYCKFHEMNLTDLLNEAIEEQERRIPHNKLSVYDRILSFRNYMVKNHSGHTINDSITKIKTFYAYNRVYLPFIPPLNTKSIKKNDFISFDDLLAKEEIRNALDYAGDDVGLWILVMLSSGSTRNEAKSMTNKMLFEGTSSDHRKDNFADALKYLSRKNNVVCTCKLLRTKTDKPYYTFLNPECVQRIAKVKLKQNDFDLNDSLLKYTPNYVNYKFKIINDVLGMGEVGGYSRFRPHMLRKFHATYLNQGVESTDYKLTKSEIDSLHGRGDKTRETYFKDNPDFLKFEYARAMGNVSLYHEYDVDIIDGKIRISATNL